MDNYLEEVISVKLQVLEDLDYMFTYCEERLQEYKSLIGDKFEFKIDVDYENLTIEVTTKLATNYDNDSERDPQLN
jgi:hypothetical protein